MTVVKELNELAYKMTGVNPKAKTDQQALNYIEQNYSGGSGPLPSNVITTENAETNGMITLNNVRYNVPIPMVYVNFYLSKLNEVDGKTPKYEIYDDYYREKLYSIWGYWKYIMENGSLDTYYEGHCLQPIALFYRADRDDTDPENPKDTYRTTMATGIEGTKDNYGNVHFEKIYFNESDGVIEITYDDVEEKWYIQKTFNN